MRPAEAAPRGGPITPYVPLIINAAVSGIVPTREEAPYLPVSESEIVDDALACVEAGASILHVHARDEDGAPSMDPERYGRITESVRKARPDAVVCVTTSGRLDPEYETRSRVLDLDGEAKPDMASLTLSSVNFPREAAVNPPDTVLRLAERMRMRGIRPELEVFDSGMINAINHLWRKEIISPPFYVNLILGSLYAAQAEMSVLAHLVGLLPPATVWAAGGVGVSQLRVNVAAMVMGGHVRVGLEDNVWFDEHKRVPAGNVALVERIGRIAAELGREIATPAQVRTMLEPGV
jgi:uncharacterized protein (DUF849 family)